MIKLSVAVNLTPDWSLMKGDPDTCHEGWHKDPALITVCGIIYHNLKEIPASNDLSTWNEILCCVFCLLILWHNKHLCSVKEFDTLKPMQDVVYKKVVFRCLYITNILLVFIIIWYSCVSGAVIGDKIIIGSGNGLVPNWHQVIAWTSVDKYIQQKSINGVELTENYIHQVKYICLICNAAG